MQAGIVSRLWFCRRSWGFKIYIRWNIVHFRKPAVCSNQLDVQETTSVSHSSTAIEIISLGVGLRMDGSFNQQHCPTQPEWHQGIVCEAQSPTDKIKPEVDQLSDVDYGATKAHSSQGESQLNTFWRQWSSHQNDNQTTKSNDGTCVQNQQSCAWLVVRQDPFRTQYPNQICWHEKPNSRTFGPKRVFSRDEWNHLLRLFNIMSFSMFSCCHFSDFLSDDQVRAPC